MVQVSWIFPMKEDFYHFPGFRLWTWKVLIFEYDSGFLQPRGKWVIVIINESLRCWVIWLTMLFRGSVAGINCLYTKQTDNSFKSTNYRFYLAKISKDATNGLVHPSAIRMVSEMITEFRWLTVILIGSYSMIRSICSVGFATEESGIHGPKSWSARTERSCPVRRDLVVCGSNDFWKPFERGSFDALAKYLKDYGDKKPFNFFKTEKFLITWPGAISGNINHITKQDFGVRIIPNDPELGDQVHFIKAPENYDITHS